MLKISKVSSVIEGQKNALVKNVGATSENLSRLAPNRWMNVSDKTVYLFVKKQNVSKSQNKLQQENARYITYVDFEVELSVMKSEYSLYQVTCTKDDIDTAFSI